MKFVELVNAVIADSQRPDMDFIQHGGDNRIPNAVVDSLFYLHTMEHFFRDIKEAQVVFPSSAFIQVFETGAVLRWRQLACFRKNDPTLVAFQQNPTLLPPLYNSVGAINLSQSMRFLKVIDIKDIIDDYNTERLDVAYQAGSNIYCKSSSAFQYGLVGFYSFPNLTYSVDNNGNVDESQFDSWIARDWPYVAKNHAVSKIFAITGYQEQSRKMDDPKTGIVPSSVAAMIMSNIVAEGP